MADDIQEQLDVALGASYRIVEEIGRGGMGIVYRARDLRLRRDVAIKLLPPALAIDAQLKKRFAREAQLAAGLNHPNIVPIFDVGDSGDLVWFIMAHIDGESVRARVEREGPFTASQTRRVLREVAWALGYAHAQGIVHRDIKPDNILLERATGRAMVTDFGIAKITEADTSGVTATGTILGSLMYMAPEQALAEEGVDARADLYGLGLVTYYMVSGRAPFPRATVMSVASRVIQGTKPDMQAIGHGADPHLRAIVERLSAPAPGDRFATAEKLLEALGPEPGTGRPLPSVIQRLVRDFALLPTFGLLVGAAWVVGGERVTVPEYLGFILLALTVNFVISLRAFVRRGFGWAELRDALDLDWIRQRQEIDATATLSERFKVFVFAALAAVLGVFLIELFLEFIWRGTDAWWAWALFIALIPIAGAGFFVFGTVLVWIWTGIGKIIASFLPSLPRPESGSWFSRFNDRLLTLLFRPIRFRRTPIERSSPPDWDRLGIAEARRGLYETRALLRRLSREDRRTAHEIPDLVHALTERLLSIRRDRSILDTVTAQQLEEYTVSARESAYCVTELRRVLRDLTEGGAAPHDVEAAIEGAKDELRLPRRPTARSRLHEVPEYAQTVDQLDKAVRERRRIEPDWAETEGTDVSLVTLANEIMTSAESHGDLRERWATEFDTVPELARKIEARDDAPRDVTLEVTRTLGALGDLLQDFDKTETWSNETLQLLLERVVELNRDVDRILAERQTPAT